MSDPSDSSATSSTASREELHAQAVRFLTSVRNSASSSEQTQREFLRSKGLQEAEIARAFDDAEKGSWASGRHETESESTGELSESNKAAVDSVATQSAGGKTDSDAFERAAREFDNAVSTGRQTASPSTMSAPDRPNPSYPRSPLALYYEPGSSASEPHLQHGPPHGQSRPQEAGLTRYQVLLTFFRKMCYMLMLGGGMTAVIVGLYRAYLLPRLTAMFDARSTLLKHHFELYDGIFARVRKLRKASLTSLSVDAGGLTAAEGQPKRGALKRVQFADDVAGGEEREDSAQISSTKEGTKNEKVVMPATDVVVSAPRPEDQEKGAVAPHNKELSEDGAEGQEVVPIDITDSIRTSLSALAAALRSDMSAAALGAPASETRSVPAPTVADGSSESGSDEEEDEDASDDGLEFDPYGSYQKKKHSQSRDTSTTFNSHVPTHAALRASLGSLSAAVSTQMFVAGTSASSGAYGGYGNLTGSPNTNADPAKVGDVGQIKAEIRSLKGLLLSRRTFPSYGRPATPSAADLAQRVPTTTAV